MRIAIVDDIASELEILRSRLETQLSHCALPVEIFEFKNGKTFLVAAGQERFDLVFLDIYMEQENGAEIAKALRAFDQNCILVFTTTSTDHALDGFKVRALQYLVKPYTDRELNSLLEEVLDRLPPPEPYIDVRIVGGETRLYFRDILYAEHFQHQIHIWTTDGADIVTRQTFREFTESLDDDRFFLCSRGVIVNLEHAADFDGTVFLMENGKKITVSRDLSKTARLAFGDFLFKRG